MIPSTPHSNQGEHLAKILDNFNEAVATMSLDAAGEKDWTERYERIRSQTADAIFDTLHIPRPVPEVCRLGGLNEK